MTSLTPLSGDQFLAGLLYGLTKLGYTKLTPPELGAHSDLGAAAAYEKLEATQSDIFELTFFIAVDHFNESETWRDILHECHNAGYAIVDHHARLLRLQPGCLHQLKESGYIPGSDELWEELAVVFSDARPDNEGWLFW